MLVRGGFGGPARFAVAIKTAIPRLAKGEVVTARGELPVAIAEDPNMEGGKGHGYPGKESDNFSSAITSRPASINFKDGPRGKSMGQTKEKP